MMYRLLRWVSGIMLHWFYSSMELRGGERIPTSGPVLLAVNHPNALVDSFIAGWLVPRRLTLTAKATLTANPLIGWLFKVLGVVPLRRSNDEMIADAARVDRTRNTRAFDEIVSVLRRSGSVLMFPEGKTHSEPDLAPLKTGLARLALQARNAGVAGIAIVPLGLNFEDKGRPGSRVIVQVGEIISMDEWSGGSAQELTAVIAGRLRRAAGATSFPEPDGQVPAKQSGLVRIAAWWGKTTHDLPVRLARNLAVAKSKSPDEPAMLTMLFGFGLVIASYAIHLVIVGFLTRSLLVSLCYLATLIIGVYWAAFSRGRSA